MGRALILCVAMFAAVPARSAERVTIGGELICFEREALRGFAAVLRERGQSAVQSVPGCIAALPGLVLTSRGRAGHLEGVGPITRMRAVSYSRGEFFDGFITARF